MSDTISNIKNINPQSTFQGPVQEKEKEKDASGVKKAGAPFWFTDPNVLLSPSHILEFFPTESMTYEEKLNAVSRTVILLTLVSFILSRNIRLLIIGLVTMGAIYVMYIYRLGDGKKTAEGFDDVGTAFLSQNRIPIPLDAFDAPSSKNPFGNVLVTDYDYNPNKKPAAPIDDLGVQGDILSQAKNLVLESNPGQTDLADKLFLDLGDQYVFEQSLRPFSSNPSTTIPNDQGAFAEFCYGSMISCKEGNQFACARNLSRHTN